MMEEGFFQEPKVWVAIAFVTVVALSYRKISGLAAQALDARAERIRNELDEARRLREEAQAVLDDYKRKQAQYLQEAETILDGARRDADALRAYAEQELKSALETRMKHALERIALEEGKAIADVRNHVVDIALAAARVLIVDHVSTLSQDELIKLALTDVERKVH